MLGPIDEKALRELGWPRLCAELASRSRTPMGRERCLSLLPADAVRRACFSQADRAPLHFEMAQTLAELLPLAQELERAFDPKGALLDSASALLAELREKARGLHRAIKAHIEEMLR